MTVFCVDFDVIHLSAEFQTEPLVTLCYLVCYQIRLKQTFVWHRFWGSIIANYIRLLGFRLKFSRKSNKQSPQNKYALTAPQVAFISLSLFSNSYFEIGIPSYIFYEVGLRLTEHEKYLFGSISNGTLPFEELLPPKQAFILTFNTGSIPFLESFNL